MKSVDEVKARALAILGVAAIGQAISAEDAARIDVMATAERLSAERIADLTPYVAANEIEDAHFLCLCEIVAADHASLYGLSVADAAALQAKGEATLLNIIRKTRPPFQALMPRIVGK